MISNKNKLLVGDVITGLAIAALFTMVAPEVAAQGFNEAVNKAQNNVAEPFARAVSYISYVMGAVMMVAGISDLRKHAQGTGDPPLNKGLGKTGAGAAFLAA
ncbi:MAG: hypothetical protein FWF23_06025, partial [Alphaproteobacteria bacterium]|nr:hypothetical protein [Alphaproteobacteria bacterium]